MNQTTGVDHRTSQSGSSSRTAGPADGGWLNQSGTFTPYSTAQAQGAANSVELLHPVLDPFNVPYPAFGFGLEAPLRHHLPLLNTGYDPSAPQGQVPSQQPSHGYGLPHSNKPSGPAVPPPNPFKIRFSAYNTWIPGQPEEKQTLIPLDTGVGAQGSHAAHPAPSSPRTDRAQSSRYNQIQFKACDPGDSSKSRGKRPEQG
ncbi:hypothetical protein K461DRAFT_39709 [Myriangium duriaei CBS 260.36]|uniref:Uncharacterized protein n=1 Tax=Myriangium duriaei CBS 260.36 TaxID=1168546 RepID=A0A9P4J0B1_9PEZI|nr:hypothetical protein K461DRAFT_39709 [Myriangium duriaei CBS 260.36]